MDSKAAFLAGVSQQERGDQALVKEHLRRYLSFFRGKKDVVDLGCGSGEFLELLKEEKIKALGIEDNPVFVAQARKRGLAVKKAKLQSFLKTCKAGSAGGFFISHVVEHLPPADMMEALSRIQKALRPGGVLVLITPNPLSLGVMTHSFWRDPTHVRPYPLDFLVQLLESMGFEILDKGETCLGVRPSLLRKGVRAVRKLLVGDYFHDPDIYLAAHKKSKS
jgi:SAM-dependent methyltransferase